MDTGASGLILALCDPSVYPHPVERVDVLETHISWVLLAGDFAYKIKKPVDFGFLNFTHLAQRRFFCEEEIRLNTRFASGIYLDVIPIGGSPAQPVLGVEPAFEYAVRMRRFVSDQLLDHYLQSGQLQNHHLDNLAKRIAEFHTALPACPEQAEYGKAETVLRPVLDNFLQLETLLSADQQAALSALEDDSRREWEKCRGAVDRRRKQGCIRECHGDLHLGNIVMVEEQPCPFDGIEFSEALRWIDIINDIAFLVMDLQRRRRPELAYRFLNAYLEITGDYDGCAVLRFYEAYRAMVKAKVAALRAAQNNEIAMWRESADYMALAQEILRPGKPALLITYGLPGCGKTAVSQLFVEKLPAIRIRSDVERKRLFGLNPTDRSHPDHALYTPEVTEQTYRRLVELASMLLAANLSVIVDAAFLRHAERRRFQHVAEAADANFVIVAIESDDQRQRDRLRQRFQDARDASDADEAVLDRLRRHAEPPDAGERKHCVVVDNNRELTDLERDAAFWAEVRGKIDSTTSKSGERA